MVFSTGLRIPLYQLNYRLTNHFGSGFSTSQCDQLLLPFRIVKLYTSRYAYLVTQGSRDDFNSLIIRQRQIHGSMSLAMRSLLTVNWHQNRHLGLTDQLWNTLSDNVLTMESDLSLISHSDLKMCLRVVYDLASLTLDEEETTYLAKYTLYLHVLAASLSKNPIPMQLRFEVIEQPTSGGIAYMYWQNVSYENYCYRCRTLSSPGSILIKSDHIENNVVATFGINLRCNTACILSDVLIQLRFAMRIGRVAQSTLHTSFVSKTSYRRSAHSLSRLSTTTCSNIIDILSLRNMNALDTRMGRTLIGMRSQFGNNAYDAVFALGKAIARHYADHSESKEPCLLGIVGEVLSADDQQKLTMYYTTDPEGSYSLFMSEYDWEEFLDYWAYSDDAEGFDNDDWAHGPEW